MENVDVANQTWKWLESTGRISAEGVQKVQAMGLDTFLAQAASEWEAQGCPRFMEGMRDVMKKIIWRMETKNDNFD